MLQVEAAPEESKTKPRKKKSLECSQRFTCAAQTFWKHWAAFSFAPNQVFLICLKIPYFEFTLEAKTGKICAPEFLGKWDFQGEAELQ